MFIYLFINFNVHLSIWSFKIYLDLFIYLLYLLIYFHFYYSIAQKSSVPCTCTVRPRKNRTLKQRDAATKFRGVWPL